METHFTYKLEDLGNLEFPGTPLAVIGHPIKHSVSPAMHNAAIAKLRPSNSRFNDWAYYRFDIAPEDLAEAVPLFYKHNFLGLNLTIPHKVQAMDLIHGVSPDGERMGAVNTLVWGEHGYHGFNTDGYGLKNGLEADLGVKLLGSTVILLGSGGAARAAAVQCILDGCKKLYVGNRRVERLEQLMVVLHAMPGGDRVEAFALGQSYRPIYLSKACSSTLPPSASKRPIQHHLTCEYCPKHGRSTIWSTIPMPRAYCKRLDHKAFAPPTDSPCSSTKASAP
jgi:shikimate dehydrogenase